MSHLVKNVAGRLVPTEINGEKATPYLGVGKFRPEGRKAAPPIRACQDYPMDGNKVTADIKTALEKAGLRDGMTISTHHHLRNGDLVANAVFAAAAELGVKDLRWFPSASFPVHEPQIALMEQGVIHHIEGSMNGPLGDYCSTRQDARHGGAALARRPLAGHPGRRGAHRHRGDRRPHRRPLRQLHRRPRPHRLRPAGLRPGRQQYADHVIAVTDNLVPFPCLPWQIQGNNVDQVVVMDCIGDASKIVSGTTQITKSPDRLLIAELTARFCDEVGIVRDGFSFQAGAGGTALSFAIYLRDMMRERKIKARFARGGSNQYLTDMLEEGLTDYILDGQTFDLEGVRSMRENPGHVNTSPFTSYNWHGKGNFASLIDVTVLGATEVDVNFNANVVTHSDGRLLHGIGGWQNCLFSRCTILPIPAFRDRIPVVVDEVTTLCGPGELVDVIVTERGIAINPLRTDLLEKVQGSSLPLVDIRELKEEVEGICGGAPEKPELGEKVVAAIKWVDGTVIFNK